MNVLEFMKRFFTLTKGPLAKFAQKSTIKKTFKNMHDFRNELIKLKKYAHDNNLEAEIKEIDMLILLADSSIEYSARLFRNATVIVDQMIKLDEKIKLDGVKKINNIESNESVKKTLIAELNKQHGDFGKLAVKELKEERQRLLPLVSTTQAGIEKTVSMESYLNILKKDKATFLDNYKMKSGFRSEVNHVLKARLEYQKMLLSIKKISRASKSAKLQGQYIKRLEEEMKQMYDHLTKAFKASFQVIMREIFLLYIIQDNLEEFYKEEEDLRVHRGIPISIAKRAKDNIDNLEKQLNNIARTEVIVIQKEVKAELNI